MNIFEINTTAYKEENFFLMTTLSREQVVSVIEPIVHFERDGDDDYDNDSLVRAVKRAFPKHKVEHYNEFETITI